MTKPKPKPGPKMEHLKIKGEWKDAFSQAIKAPPMPKKPPSKRGKPE